MEAENIVSRNGLTLFFTLGVTLTDWQAAGYLEREADYYRRLSEHVGPVTWVTYGAEDDGILGKAVDGIRVLNNTDNLPSEVFIRECFNQYEAEFMDCALFKSNQIKGAGAAIQAGKYFGGKSIIRCGYLLSRFKANELPSLRTKFGLWRREASLFRYADHVFLPTEEDIQHAKRWYNLRQATVLPNFVDVQQFKPLPEVEKIRGLIGFVGRLVPQKNLAVLIEAASQVEGAKLRIIGEGPQAEELQAMANNLNVPVEFTGNVPHATLPALLAACDVFALPSLYEGMPKALIEAMAMGLPSVATIVDGSDAIIEHGKTGWLCETSAAAPLAAGLKLLLSDAALRQELGQAGREAIVARFSKEIVLAQEVAIYRRLLDG